MGSFELYRQTMLGDCLCEALEEMVGAGKISKELAMSVLHQFDKSIFDALEHQVVGKAHIKANLRTYRFYDNVWQFVLDKVQFRINFGGNGSMSSAPEFSCDKAKVICVDAKLVEGPGS